MARETVVTLVDDLDGSTADETVVFGLDGWAYEIDLNEVNAKTLRSAIVDFIGSARRLGKMQSGAAATPVRRGAARPRSDKEQNRAIRGWAGQNGFSIADRGRIPAEVVEAFHQAH